MTLREQQSLFAKLLPRLIDYAYKLGYEITLGEAYRTPEQAALNAARGIGIKNSLHTDRLAIDLNLFVNGEFRADAESHRPLADYWKSLHPDCRAGIDFGDANHYSLTWQGRK